MQKGNETKDVFLAFQRAKVVVVHHCLAIFCRLSLSSGCASSDQVVQTDDNYVCINRGKRANLS